MVQNEEGNGDEQQSSFRSEFYASDGFIVPDT